MAEAVDKGCGRVSEGVDHISRNVSRIVGTLAVCRIVKLAHSDLRANRVLPHAGAGSLKRGDRTCEVGVAHHNGDGLVAAVRLMIDNEEVLRISGPGLAGVPVDV